MTSSKPVHLWKRAPFTRLLPALVAGILVEHYLQPSLIFIFSLLIVAVLSMFLISIQKVATRFSHRVFAGTLWMVMIFLMGMLASHFNNIRNDKAWHGHYFTQAEYWEVTIITPPEEKENSIKALAKVEYGYGINEVFSVKGKSLLYLSKDSNAASLRQGDILFIRNKFQPIRNTGNPGSFDYRNYMAHQHIFFQAYLSENGWKNSGRSSNNWFDNVILASLNYENNLFEKYLHGEREIALAKALVTGDRSDLDPELVQAYSNAGVVHIMSISGLHLGLIYIFLLQMTKLLPFFSRNKIARGILILGGIWFFAILTGCSPSVMRSAVMFSCLLIGQLMNRKIPTYNFWSASAFLLLCFDPMLLWNVGFQLSYTAVLGILIAQKPIYHWIHFDNKLVDYLWQLIAVSLAAQIFTLPICLYYFHQVPLLFIVANIVAIPLSSIGLWLSLLLIMAGWMPYIPIAIGAITSKIFEWLNRFISYLDSFVFTVWNGIHLNLAETFIALLFLAFTTYWFLHKRKAAFKAAIICVFLIVISSVYGTWEIANRQQLIVYNIRATSAIDVISGRKYFGIMDKDLERKTPAIQTARQYLGVEKPDNLLQRFEFGKNEFYWGAIPIGVIKSNPGFDHLPKEKIRLKAIVLSNSPQVQLSDLNKIFVPDIYIFTPANKRSQIEKWKKECEELHLRAHDISMQGAYVMDY